MMGEHDKPARGERVPDARLLDGIARRPSLKAEYGRLLPGRQRTSIPAANPSPRAMPLGAPSRLSMPDKPGDTLTARMADALLLAYVGLRGHLHAPGKVSLERLLAEISETLSATGTLLNWLPWEGGECPLPAHVEVEIMWSDGGKQVATAGEIAWAVPAAAGLVDLVQELRFVMFYRVVRW